MNNFTMIDNAILNDQSLTTVHKMIYVALASFIDNKTRSCYPSYGTLAEKAGCSRNTAITAMKTLVEKGYVIKVRKNDGKKYAHACNLYILANIEPEEPDPENTDPSPHEPDPTPKKSNKKEAHTAKDNVALITAFEKLPTVRKAFPQAKDLLDIIEKYHTDTRNTPDALPNPPDVLPSPQDKPPSHSVAPELYPLNYTPLNYTQSIYQSEDRKPYGERDKILEKLDEHFGYENFSSDENIKARYIAITGYIAEMLLNPYTRICKQNMSRDEIANMVFSTTTSTMHDFLRHIDQQFFTLATTKIRDTPAYFKTVFIEFLRSNQLIYGQCI